MSKSSPPPPAAATPARPSEYLDRHAVAARTCAHRTAEMAQGMRDADG